MAYLFNVKVFSIVGRQLPFDCFIKEPTEEWKSELVLAVTAGETAQNGKQHGRPPGDGKQFVANAVEYQQHRLGFFHTLAHLSKPKIMPSLDTILYD